MVTKYDNIDIIDTIRLKAFYIDDIITIIIYKKIVEDSVRWLLCNMYKRCSAKFTSEIACKQL